MLRMTQGIPTHTGRQLIPQELVWWKILVLKITCFLQFNSASMFVFLINISWIAHKMCEQLNAVALNPSFQFTFSFSPSHISFQPLQRRVKWTTCCSRQLQPSWSLWCASGSFWKRPASSLCGPFSSPTSYRDPSKKRGVSKSDGHCLFGFGQVGLLLQPPFFSVPVNK